jgi:predicted Zn-dependent protease
MLMRFKTSRLIVRLLAACCFVLVSLSGPTSAKAISFIRDTEIENTIRVFSAPIFKAAGLDIADVQIHIVNDPTLNAFVAAGQRLFINTGLLMRAEHAGQVIGVIAHEAGHISGGHLVRLHEGLRGSTAKSVLTTLFGGVAASYTRSMEQSADQAAVTYLDEAGYSGRGLAEFLGTLSKEEALLTGSQDIYLRSHPLTRNRIKFMNDHVAKSELSDKPLPADVREAHDRMRAKLKGFINPPARTLREYKADDPSFSARYARAIAYKELHDIDTSLALIDGLIAEHPNDPFLYELKGDVLQDAGRVAESISPYNKALEFLPWAALIRVNLAQSQLEAKDLDLGEAALQNLLQAVRYEPEMPFLWRLLSTAYARSGDQAKVMLSLAEEALLLGKPSEAAQRATRALEMLPEGSAGARRAQDIQNAAKNE